MENSSRALMIAGVILVVVLIITFSIMMLTNLTMLAGATMSNLTTEEVNAVNSKYEGYDGIQIGSRIKVFIGEIIATCSTYKEADDIIKIPNVRFIVDDGSGNKVENLIARPANTPAATYVSNLSTQRRSLTTQSTYVVEYIYNEYGLIDELRIIEQSVYGK